MSFSSMLPEKLREFLLNLPLPDSWLDALRGEPYEEVERDYLREERKPGSWRMPTAIAITVLSAYVVYLIMR